MCDTLLSEVAAKIRQRECVLFLGAAIHAAPPPALDHTWPLGQRPPVGSELSRRLAARSGYTSRHPGSDIRDLKRVSLDYEMTRQRSLLVDAIRQEVQTGKTGSRLISDLAGIDFPVVVTTNYDTHFEDALMRNGKRPFVSAYKNNLDTTELTDDYPFLHARLDQPLVLKIHGDILRTSDSIVVTEEDYIQFVLRMSDKPPYHPVPELARTYLTKGATLFLGYGMNDYNLRLLFKTLRWRMKNSPSAYSVDFRPDSLVQEVLERRTGQLSYFVQDVWEFVPALLETLR